MSKKNQKESVITDKLYRFDKEILLECDGQIIGTDEVGRGSLAGPVVAAAVSLDPEKPITGINDSKKLTAQKRDTLYNQIISEAISWAVGSASPEEIDKLNILQASLLAMHRAIQQLKCSWKLVLVDGNQMIPYIDHQKQRIVIGGDATSASIAAASIVAKVTRDRIMDEYNQLFPVYEFNNNKGYATEHHRNCIVDHGMCSIHRRSFCEVLAIQTRLPL